MNNVCLAGRLVKDPVVSVNLNNQKKVARFTVAVSRTKEETDYINVVAFGKTAEIVEQYFAKGKAIGVNGSIKTGSYEKDGKKVYTTDVWADKIEFLPGDSKPVEKQEQIANPFDTVVPGFAKINDEDIPF